MLSYSMLRISRRDFLNGVAGGDHHGRGCAGREAYDQRADEGGVGGCEGARQAPRPACGQHRSASGRGRAAWCGLDAGEGGLFAADLAPVLNELADLSANAAAAELERRGYPTARGGRWTAGKVINVRARLGR
jgi:hypothetical protein